MFLKYNVRVLGNNYIRLNVALDACVTAATVVVDPPIVYNIFATVHMSLFEFWRTCLLWVFTCFVWV